jgi:hypothetical protein
MNAKVSQKNSKIKKWAKNFFTKLARGVHSGYWLPGGWLVEGLWGAGLGMWLFWGFGDVAVLGMGNVALSGWGMGLF